MQMFTCKATKCSFGSLKIVLLPLFTLPSRLANREMYYVPKNCSCDKIPLPVPHVF